MKKKMMKLGVFTLLTALLTGCTAKNKVSEEFKEIVESFSDIYLTLDADGHRVDKALDAVGAYLEEGTSYEDTAKVLEDAITEIDQASKNQKEFVVDEEMAELLRAYDISPEEYREFGNFRTYELNNQSQTIFILLEYVTYADLSEEDYNNLVRAYELQTEYQKEMKIYYYYMCLNYWFKSATEPEKEYLQEQVMKNIKSYQPENSVWYTDEKELEDAVALCLDRIEANNEEWVVHLAGQRESLYDMENLLERLKALAEKRAEVERLQQELDEAKARLAELKQINARIEEIDAEALKAKEEGDEAKFEELKKEYEGLLKRWDEIQAEIEKDKQD